MLVILDKNRHIIISIWTLKRHGHELDLLSRKHHIDLDFLHGIPGLTVSRHAKTDPTLAQRRFFLGNLGL